MRLRAKDRIEVKARFTPELHAVLEDFKRLYGIEDTSAALVRIATLFLCGVKGILPPSSEPVSAQVSQSVPERQR